MGMHFYGLSAEMDSQARAVASSNMPALVHCDRVETLRAADLVPFLRRRRVRGILLGGGSPCQGNSILNKRRLGLDDERSCQPLLLVELRAEIEALPEAEGLLRSFPSWKMSSRCQRKFAANTLHGSAVIRWRSALAPVVGLSATDSIGW